MYQAAVDLQMNHSLIHYIHIPNVTNWDVCLHMYWAEMIQEHYKKKKKKKKKMSLCG